MTMEYSSLDNSPPPKSHKGRFWYHAFLLSFSVLLAATVVALFPAFHFAQWSLPTKYSLKETQQYVNFVVVALALLISWLLSHCLSITNDAEATAEFETKTFSLARLQTRSAAAGKDVVDLLRFASHNGRLWSVAGPFALSLTAFSAMAWVLSLLFVIEARLVPGNELLQVNVTLGINVPTMPDACRGSLTSAGCTYDLATSALASQLVTHTPYTFDNITFSGATGTQALPVGALQNFANGSANSRFSSERSQYCLPVLKPNLITCTPDTNNSRAKYVYMNSRYDSFLKINYDSYKLIINPDTAYNQSYVLVSSNGDGGVMSVAHSGIPGEREVSILTGSGQYADLLSRLHNGTSIPFTQDFYNATVFTVVCEQPSNSTTYSWQWIDFEMSGGVMTTNTTGEICKSNDGDAASPIAWLDYALEGAVSSAQLRDGYSKLLNVDYLETSGEDYDRMKQYDMSALEYILSHIVAIVNTAWTATNADIAGSTQIEQRKFEHRYVVDVEIQGPTILALCVAALILICAIIQAVRWIRAQIALKKHGRTGHVYYDLLDPLQLLAYGSMAAESVSRLRLGDEEKRLAIMKDMSGPTLGFGPGTLAPNNGITSEVELAPRYSAPPSRARSRSESNSRLIARHSDDDLPGWDDLQSQRSAVSPLPTPSSTNGMRPLMLRASSSRSYGFD